jgi:hypothetical protein
VLRPTHALERRPLVTAVAENAALAKFTIASLSGPRPNFVIDLLGRVAMVDF